MRLLRDRVSAEDGQALIKHTIVTEHMRLYQRTGREEVVVGGSEKVGFSLSHSRIAQRRSDHSRKFYSHLTTTLSLASMLTHVNQKLLSRIIYR